MDAPQNDSPKSGKRLAIVGNGMVCAHFCSRLAEQKLTNQYQVTVLGREPVPAYDRIHLSSYVETRNATALELKPAEWYQQNNIELKVGNPAEEVHTDKHKIITSDGSEIPYDILVFATGSEPFVPDFTGSDLPGVYVYRTIGDIEAICQWSNGKSSGAIIGGGLLGLEAARALQQLGVDEVHVLQLGSFLMPQQLDEDAGRTLEKLVTEQGIFVHTNKDTERIVQDGDQLIIHFKDGTLLKTQITLICAGVRPNTTLAEKAGISCGIRGGIIVNDSLECSVPGIYAIGECALYHGQSYGLAAPGYEMADTLVDHLSGGVRMFTGADLSTRLKMLGIDVITLGSPLEEGERYVWKGGGKYRKLVLQQGNLIGSLSVGDWPESTLLQPAIQQKSRITEGQLKRFLDEGSLWDKNESFSVHTMDDAALICNCMQVSKGTLWTCVQEGCRSVEALAEKTGASTVCGSCKPLLSEMTGTPPDPLRTIPAKLLISTSVLAALAALGTWLTPGVSMADSVESWWFQVDSLWRDGLLKRITGFSLLGISIFATLLSLRKRIFRFQWGDFMNWRVIHAGTGIVGLIILFLHTGFHMGSNLNFWLMACFLGLNALGALAGVISGVEASSMGRWGLMARRWRPQLTLFHQLIFWPFVVLLIFHIAAAFIY